MSLTMRSYPPPPRLHWPAGLPLLAFCVLVFGVLALDLLNQGVVTRSDAAMSTWFREHLPAGLTQMLLAVTHLHSTAGIILLALVAAMVLARYRQASWIGALVLCVPGGLVLNALVKQAFQRARPSFDSPLVSLTSYSFPSGHTAGATVWWGFFLVLLYSWQRGLRWRATGTALAVTMIMLTALSRVYLGVHYPSDVLAAIAEGVGWLAICFMAISLTQPRGTRQGPRDA